MEFDFYLTKQIELHPSMQMQDVVKMCYQAIHGPEHMLTDIERAKAYYSQEYETTPADSSAPLFEPLSDAFCRVNISAWKAKNLEPEQLFQLFVRSAEKNTSCTEAEFDRYAQTVEIIISKGLLPFSIKEWKDYYAAYKKNGMHPVHHSDAYRLTERPAYRLVRRNLLGIDTN